MSILEQKQAAILQLLLSNVLWHTVILWQTCQKVSTGLTAVYKRQTKHPTPCLLDLLRLRTTHILDVQLQVWILSFHISHPLWTVGSCRHLVLRRALWNLQQKMAVYSKILHQQLAGIKAQLSMLCMVCFTKHSMDVQLQF